MERELTCIVCPMGCALKAQIDGDEVAISGNSCPRGKKYGEQEIKSPMRTVTSSIYVEGAGRLCPVKTSAPVPKERIDDVLAAIRAARLIAPVELGAIVLRRVAGLEADVVATASRRSCVRM